MSAYKQKKVEISVSILSGDFSNLGSEVQRCKTAGADWMHLDIMDGRFVPNLTFGYPILKAIRKSTDLPLDSHLMVVEPENYLEGFASAGSDLISIHQEASTQLKSSLMKIKSLGKKAGVVLNPATPLESINDVIDEVDLVLLMSVNPGFSGQKFMPDVIARTEKIANLREKRNLDFDIEVDGGVSDKNAKTLIEAGANILVSASFLFKAENMKQAIDDLRCGYDGSKS